MEHIKQILTDILNGSVSTQEATPALKLAIAHDLPCFVVLPEPNGTYRVAEVGKHKNYKEMEAGLSKEQMEARTRFRKVFALRFPQVDPLLSESTDNFSSILSKLSDCMEGNPDHPDLSSFTFEELYLLKYGVMPEIHNPD